jgi:hypothetical protein
MSVSASRVSYQGHMTPAWLFVGGWLGEPKLGRKDTRQESEMSVDRRQMRTKQASLNARLPWRQRLRHCAGRYIQGP